MNPQIVHHMDQADAVHHMDQADALVDAAINEIIQVLRRNIDGVGETTASLALMCELRELDHTQLFALASRVLIRLSKTEVRP